MTTAANEDKTVVIDHSADDAAAAAGAEAPEPGAALEPEFDYDAEFAAQVARNEARKTGGEPADDKPAAEPKPVDTPAATTEQPAAMPAPVEDDLIALLPEDKREAARARFKAAEDAVKETERLRHDNRSMAGRVSAYQRKYEEAQGKAPAVVKKEATEEQHAAYKQFAEDYPDIAKGMEAMLAAKAPGTNPDTDAMVEFVQEERRNRFLTDAWTAVEAVHQGAKATAGTKEFREWKDTSPTYERLASSDDVADAIALFDLYDAHRSKGAPAKPVVDPKQAAEAAKLAARREAQAEGGRAPASHQASPNTSVDGKDEDQMFALYAQKADERIRRRNR